MGGSAEKGTLSEGEIVVGIDKLVGEYVDDNKKEPEMIWDLFQGQVFQLFQVHWLSNSESKMANLLTHRVV